jgi:hypothetical protein
VSCTAQVAVRSATQSTAASAAAGGAGDGILRADAGWRRRRGRDAWLRSVYTRQVLRASRGEARGHAATAER